MHAESEVSSVYTFLKDTPEGPLKKMFVGTDFSEGHFRMLMKIVRGANEGEFIEAFNGESVPKVRLTPAEYPLKETIWPAAKKKLMVLGLLGAEVKQAA